MAGTIQISSHHFLASFELGRLFFQRNLFAKLGGHFGLGIHGKNLVVEVSRLGFQLRDNHGRVVHLFRDFFQACFLQKGAQIRVVVAPSAARKSRRRCSALQEFQKLVENASAHASDTTTDGGSGGTRKHVRKNLSKGISTRVVIGIIVLSVIGHVVSPIGAGSFRRSCRIRFIAGGATVGWCPSRCAFSTAATAATISLALSHELFIGTIDLGKSIRGLFLFLRGRVNVGDHIGMKFQCSLFECSF